MPLLTAQALYEVDLLTRRRRGGATQVPHLAGVMLHGARRMRGSRRASWAVPNQQLHYLSQMRMADVKRGLDGGLKKAFHIRMRGVALSMLSRLRRVRPRSKAAYQRLLEELPLLIDLPVPTSPAPLFVAGGAAFVSAMAFPAALASVSDGVLPTVLEDYPRGTVLAAGPAVAATMLKEEFRWASHPRVAACSH